MHLGKSTLFWLLFGIVIIVGAAIFFSRAPSGPSSFNTEPTATSSLEGAEMPPGTEGGVSVNGFSILTPREGDVWAKGTLHEISFNKPLKVTPGGAYLVDATTGQAIGWILSGIGANQTSFSWNSNSVTLTRFGQSSKDIPTGRYLIKVIVDNTKEVASSGRFFVVDTGTPEIVTYTVRFSNYTITPNVLMVPRGAKIMLINNDTYTQKISLGVAGGVLYTLAPKGYGMVDTVGLTPGTYTFSSNVYGYREKGTIIVQAP